MKNNYTVYHLHSDFSNGVTNIDSVTKYTHYIKRAQELGMTALAFSEHGSVFSWLHKKEDIEKAGMKYIHAEEFYVTEKLVEDDDLPPEEQKRIRDNYHCVLIARNERGFHELNRLSSIAFNPDHFYYVPRITFDELLGTSENIIITTACLGGILNKASDDLKNRFIRFLTNNRDRCYLEIQHHNVDDQIRYNKYLYDLHLLYNIPLIAGTDTHALNDEHLEARSILQKAKDVLFAEETEWDLTFKSYDELVSAYVEQNSIPMDAVFEAIENTNKMADMVEPFNIDRSYKYPRLYDDPLTVLRKKIEDGIRRRGVDRYKNYKEYIDRIEYELSVYQHNGAVDFILLMEDVIAFCRDNSIDTGWGRGSVTGSIICWILGITEMDSIKYNLSFERFMNLERVSLADIDTDIPPSRIPEIKEYLFHKHGLYCADIITFNTIADKGAIRDVCRALYKDDEKRDYLAISSELCAMVDSGQSINSFPNVAKYVDICKGVIVSCGNHPCGLVVAPFDIVSRLGTFHSSTDQYPITQLYMKEIDSLNFVKLDLLKLDTIELIAETCKLAGIPMIKPETLDVSDVNVWNSIRDDTTQIFQWEGNTGNDYIKRLMSDKNVQSFKRVSPNLDRMTLLTIGNSAIRPAGASYRDDLANGVVRSTGSPAIDDFLRPTFGYLVYQEQIIFFLNKFCGYSMGEADIVRRGFAKKTGTEQFIPKIKEGFIKTTTEKYGMTRAKAERDIVAFIKVIEDASSYLFSQNHSVPYSFEGYASGWLRYYYPLEFLTSALNINKDKEEKTMALTAYAKKHSVKISNPKFRYSKAHYFCDKDTGTIYKGIASIKHLNESAANELYAMRDRCFSSFTDLLVAIISETHIDTRQLDLLIKIDFFAEFGNTAKLLKITRLFFEFYDKTNRRFKKQMKKDKVAQIQLTDEIFKVYAHKETEKMFSQIDFYGMLLDIEKNINFAPDSTLTRIRYQQEILGNISIIDKRYKDYACVVDVDVKYSPRVKCYAIANGRTMEARVSKQQFNRVGLKVGDIIYIKDYKFKPKNGFDPVTQKWLPIPGTKVLWITNYRIATKYDDKDLVA